MIIKQSQRTLCGVLGAVTLLCGFNQNASDAAEQHPNVVLFLVDDMGPLDTSVPFLTDSKGHPERYPLNDFYRTPAMERLASHGVRFSTFYAMSVCSPTRTSIITGQNAARHRVTQWIRSEENNRGEFGPPDWRWVGVQDPSVTLPGVLRENGYRTIFVGKAHFGPLGELSEWPTNLGFDVNIAGCSWGQPGSYYGLDGYGDIKGNKRRAVPHLEKYHGTETFLSEALTIEAKKQITRAVEDKKPFFLDFAHYAVHAPFQSDPRFASHYKDSGKPKNAQAYATLIEGMDKSLGTYSTIWIHWVLPKRRLCYLLVIMVAMPRLVLSMSMRVRIHFARKRVRITRAACEFRLLLPGHDHLRKALFRSDCIFLRVLSSNSSARLWISTRLFLRSPAHNPQQTTHSMARIYRPSWKGIEIVAATRSFSCIFRISIEAAISRHCVMEIGNSCTTIDQVIILPRLHMSSLILHRIHLKNKTSLIGSRRCSAG